MVYKCVGSDDCRRHQLQVLEVVAETGAPKREIELLLADLPSEAAQADRAATAAAVADAEQMVKFSGTFDGNDALRW